MDKAEAIKAEEKTYDGTPCKRGHTKRFVKGGKCAECTVEATRKSRAKKGKTGKAAKSKAVTVIPRDKLYDGTGKQPITLGRIARRIRKSLKEANRHLEATGFHIKGVCAALGSARELCTEVGFSTFCKEVGLGRSRAYELLAIADGRKTIEEVRSDATERQRRSRERKAVRDVTDEPKAEPGSPVIDAEVIEVTPPPAEPEPAKPEKEYGPPKPVEEYVVVHLDNVAGRILRAERYYPLDKIAAVFSDNDGTCETTPEQLEKAAAFLMRLAEAMRRKKAA